MATAAARKTRKSAVTRAPHAGVLDGEAPDAPEAVPLARPPSAREHEQGEENGTAPDDWHEPAYYASPGPNPGRRWALGLAVLLFIAAPVALLVALAAH